MEQELELIKSISKSIVPPKIVAADLIESAFNRKAKELEDVIFREFAGLTPQSTNVEIATMIFKRRYYLRTTLAALAEEARGPKDVYTEVPLWFYPSGKLFISASCAIVYGFVTLLLLASYWVILKPDEEFVRYIILGLSLVFFAFGTWVIYYPLVRFFAVKGVIGKIRNSMTNFRTNTLGNLDQLKETVASDYSEYLKCLIGELNELLSVHKEEKRVIESKLAELTEVPIEKERERLVTLRSQLTAVRNLRSELSSSDLRKMKRELIKKIRETDHFIKNYAPLQEMVKIELKKYDDIASNLNSTVIQLTNQRITIISKSKLLLEISQSIDSQINLEYSADLRYRRELAATFNRLKELNDSLAAITTAAQEEILQLPNSKDILALVA